MEEERRLFYVALIRAKSALSLSCAQTRYRWGTSTTNAPSRFLKEIDPQCFNRPLQKEQKDVRQTIQSNLVIPDILADDPLVLKVGQRVEHEKFGAGTILGIEGRNVADKKAVVSFDQYGTKTLLLKFARMRLLSS